MLSRRVVAILVLCAPTLVYADDDDDEDLAEEYTKQGTFEIGGSIAATFASDSIAVAASPRVGYFPIDRVELALEVRLSYERVEDDLTDSHVTTKSGAVIVEPSYHYPATDNLAVFGAVGVGPGFDGDHAELDVVPRVGVNIITARGVVITPSARLPILVGKTHGDNGDVGTDVELVLDLGVSASW